MIRKGPLQSGEKVTHPNKEEIEYIATIFQWELMRSKSKRAAYRKLMKRYKWNGKALAYHVILYKSYLAGRIWKITPESQKKVLHTWKVG